MNELVDFSRPMGEEMAQKIVNFQSLSDPLSAVAENGASHGYHGPVYGLRDFPGFYYCPNAMSVGLQHELAFAAVSHFCEPPQHTNIDLIPPKQEEEEDNRHDSFWSVYKEARRKRVELKQERGNHNGASAASSSSSSKSRRLYKSFDKLSWATLGYHYDWTARFYNPETFTAIPPLVHYITKPFATMYFRLHGQQTALDTTCLYNPTACICNYYHEKSIMGGHRDESEYAVAKPIISFSVGRCCIFLLGQYERDATPIVPILVRPGDVMIMGGETRQNYHAMARLLPATTSGIPRPDPMYLPTMSQQIPPSLSPENSSSSSHSLFAFPTQEDSEALIEFLETHRINFNARQVFNDGDDPLFDTQGGANAV
jgi:DNA alkylation damage repair protein AlkB